jgi:hypothetical protein
MFFLVSYIDIKGSSVVILEIDRLNRPVNCKGYSMMITGPNYFS